MEILSPQSYIYIATSFKIILRFCELKFTVDKKNEKCLTLLNLNFLGA